MGSGVPLCGMVQNAMMLGVVLNNVTQRWVHRADFVVLLSIRCVSLI